MLTQTPCPCVSPLARTIPLATRLFGRRGQGIDTLPRQRLFIRPVDALGVCSEQHLDTVASPLGNLWGRYAAADKRWAVGRSAVQTVDPAHFLWVADPFDG